MMNDFELELISLMELKEIKREKRFNDILPDHPSYQGSAKEGSCVDHFEITLADYQE